MADVELPLNIDLFTTLGCSLCEDAEDLLAPYRDAGYVAVTAVDVAEEADLMERYGERIPVLRHREIGTALFWPFDAKTLHQYLDKLATS